MFLHETSGLEFECTYILNLGFKKAKPVTPYDWSLRCCHAPGFLCHDLADHAFSHVQSPFSLCDYTCCARDDFPGSHAQLSDLLRLAP